MVLISDLHIKIFNIIVYLIGAVMIFTGLLSVAFLNAKLQPHKWLGILMVVIGLSVIGVCDFIYSNSSTTDTNGIIAGNCYYK
jgi:drug/metabolite transporter (DMT)-like permease